jgi:hypothetical protein
MMLDLRPAVGSISTFIWEIHWTLEVISGITGAAMFFIKKRGGGS